MQNEDCFQRETCICAKQHKHPFPSFTSKTEKPGEVVHADICGPTENQSLGGSRYFLLLKDDYTHYRKVYFLKRKNEVKDKLNEFIPRFRTETGNKVKVI